MKRIFHPYTRCEEYAAGMWRNTSIDERAAYIASAADLMRHAPLFLSAMLRAVREWPCSCEANLTTKSINQRAWLGHAGCLLATGSPEDLTRLAWHTLTPAEQHAANAAADQAIAAWTSMQIHLRANPGATVHTGGSA